MASKDNKKGLKCKAFESFMAMLLFRGINQSIYGELGKDYWKFYTYKVDMHPKLIAEIIYVMRQIPVEKCTKPEIEKQNDKGNQGYDEGIKIPVRSFVQKYTIKRCHFCGLEHHMSP